MNIRPTNFPLVNDTNKFGATAAEITERYKNMLDFQAAGQDTGLFYQLNAVATEKAGAEGQPRSGLNNGHDSDPAWAPVYS